MYLLDSDQLILFLKGDHQTTRLITRLWKDSDHMLATSIITVAEIIEGLSFPKEKRSSRLAVFQKLLDQLHILPIDLKVAQVFAFNRAHLRKHGLLIPNFDLLIAASCLAYDLTLVTNNIKHFQRLSDLKIYRHTS